MSRRLYYLLLTLFIILSMGILPVGLAGAQQPDPANPEQPPEPEPADSPTPQPADTQEAEPDPANQEQPPEPEPTDTQRAEPDSAGQEQPPEPDSTAAPEPQPTDTRQLETNEASQSPVTPTLQLAGSGWLTTTAASPGSDVSILALPPVDCNTMSPPVVGYEISKGQDSNDITDFGNDLIANGFSVGTVNINAGPIPPCLDVLIVQALVNNSFLNAAYTPADAALLQAWAASGQGLMISGDWGPFRASVAALFQIYGYSLQGANAVTDPTDFDPAEPTPARTWVIYQQADNFANHPILNGATSLQLLASSWLSPTANALVTTDADATPANQPVMAAFTDGAGCVALVTDSNWNAVMGTANGYFKADNATIARQMVNWLNSCSSLALTKLASPSPVQPGGLLTYTLTAVNNSALPLTNVLITDTLPTSTTFANATLPHAGPNPGGVITWSLGALNLNASATVTMVVQVDNSVLTGTLISNTARVTSTEGLSDTATALTPVGFSSVNPVLTKAVTPRRARPGQVVTFTLSVRQLNANSIATNVQVVDQLPPALEIVSVQASPGFSTQAGQQLTWTIPVLNPLDQGSLIFQARVRTPSTLPAILPNQATLSFDQGPDRLSNRVELFVPAPPQPAPNDNDDDDDDQPAAPPPPPLARPAGPTPVPTAPLPVSLLPDTGQAVAHPSIWLWLVMGLGLALGLLYKLKSPTSSTDIERKET